MFLFQLDRDLGTCRPYYEIIEFLFFFSKESLLLFNIMFFPRYFIRKGICDYQVYMQFAVITSSPPPSPSFQIRGVVFLIPCKADQIFFFLYKVSFLKSEPKYYRLQLVYCISVRQRIQSTAVAFQLFNPVANSWMYHEIFLQCYQIKFNLGKQEK